MGIRRAEFDRCFELEVLEPRVMLSADGMATSTEGADTGVRIELEAGSQEFSSASTTSDGGATLQIGKMGICLKREMK